MQGLNVWPSKHKALSSNPSTATTVHKILSRLQHPPLSDTIVQKPEQRELNPSPIPTQVEIQDRGPGFGAKALVAFRSHWMISLLISIWK
jgi:hypothetical protein